MGSGREGDLVLVEHQPADRQGPARELPGREVPGRRSLAADRVQSPVEGEVAHGVAGRRQGGQLAHVTSSYLLFAGSLQDHLNIGFALINNKKAKHAAAINDLGVSLRILAHCDPSRVLIFLL